MKKILPALLALSLIATSSKAEHIISREEADGYLALFVFANIGLSATSLVRAEKLEDRLHKQHMHGKSEQRLKDKAHDLYHAAVLSAALSAWGLTFGQSTLNAYYGKKEAGVRFKKRF